MIDGESARHRLGSLTRRSERRSHPSTSSRTSTSLLMEVRERWLPILAGIVLAASLVRGLVRYGGTQVYVLYEMLLVAAVAAVLALFARSAALDGRRQLVGMLGAGVVGALAIALSPTVAAIGWVHAFLGWTALLVVLVLAERGEEAQRAIVMTLVLIGGAEALFGLSQALGEESRGARGTFYNRNHFAGVLMMCLPLALGLLQAALSRRSRHRSRGEARAMTWIVVMAAAVMGAAVLLSRSRGGAMVLVGVLMLQAGLLVVQRRAVGGHAGARQGLPVGVVALLLVLVLVFAAIFGLGPLLERFAHLEGGGSRLRLYRDTLHLIAGHPLGVGPGSYQWDFRPYQTQALNVWYQHAEDDYLEVVAEWGLIPGLLWWGFVVRRWWRSIRAFLSSRRSWTRGLAFGTAGSLSAVLLHSLVDFNLQIPSNLMVFAAVLALAWSLDLVPLDPASRGLGDRSEGGA
jgi:hypothetical protein